jgi:hypothetical protein
MTGATRRCGQPEKPLTEMKPEGQSDLIAARFAAELFMIRCAGFSWARWQLMNNCE